LRSLDKCPVLDELFQNDILDPQDARLTQHLTREDFDYWMRQLPHDKSPGDDELTHKKWQEAPAEMKDALYQVVNQVIQNGQMPTSWEEALATLIPKRVGEEKFFESIRPICLMNTAAKIVTSVWAKRLSKSLEQQSVFEGSQEGFRPDRSTQRQISRFISALQDVERNQSTICVTFLYFENYFKTIFLPALFLLVRKFGMNEKDVQAIESYYEHLHVRVIHAGVEKSAKIPLHRGLRQGCPLSPVLGRVVVNAMLRWLDFKRGGLSQGDVVTTTLCFANDSTLMTTNVQDMNVLLASINSHCQWAGVKINLSKTEVTGYDYKRQCPLDLSSLQLGNGKPKIVMPWDPVKYLKVRLTSTGDLTSEHDYVRKKTLDTIKQLTKHMYHPQQFHWVVQVAIILIFRYSATIVNWDSKKIDKLENCGCMPSRKHGKSMTACQT